MLTVPDLCGAFERAGLTVCAVRFRDPPEPPWCCYHLGDSEQAFADDNTYRLMANYYFDLHAADRDFDLERKVEDALREIDAPFTKEGGYDDDNDLIITSYRISGVAER